MDRHQDLDGPAGWPRRWMSRHLILRREAVAQSEEASPEDINSHVGGLRWAVWCWATQHGPSAGWLSWVSVQAGQTADLIFATATPMHAVAVDGKVKPGQRVRAGEAA